jgi:hypothetical protein
MGPARYRDLPETAVQELTELFDTLVARHGLTPRPETITIESETTAEATP